MSRELGIILTIYTTFLIGFIVIGYIPIYKSRRRKFSNFTIADFCLFVFFLPAELIYIVFSSPTIKLVQLLKSRPLKKMRFKVGDKVIYAGNVYTVLAVHISQVDYEEVLELSGIWHKVEAKVVKSVSPLEKLL